jgi:hypothetical protein
MKSEFKSFRVHFLNCEGTKCFHDVLTLTAEDAEKVISHDDGVLDETAKVLEVEELGEPRFDSEFPPTKG